MKQAKTRRSGAARLAAVAAAAALLALPAQAAAQSMDPDQARARELVLRIRKSMREIDALLLQGAQPRKVEQELEANAKRIEELLKETESKSQSVIQNIDELVKLTKYQKSGGGGGGGGSMPDQKSRDPAGSMPERERSQEPGELVPQPRPQPRDGSEPGERPDEQERERDGDPKSGRPDRASPDQRDARRPPPEGATGQFERQDLSGRWGMLPPKQAEELQRRNADEFPQRYRRWMELYFRRVNKLPSRDR